MTSSIFKGKVKITGKIKTLTGLHIGGTHGGIEIGGVDTNVIKGPDRRPYIPGSSLKGKLRSLMEGLKEKAPDYTLVSGDNEIKIHMCETEDEMAEDCPVCAVFGAAADEAGLQTRLTIRDANLLEKSLAEYREDLELEWTEVKWENAIDRITSRAHPRQLERVPRGAEFKSEMIFTIYRKKDREHLEDFTRVMKLLEDDYLGASGSRGYGRVQWEDLGAQYISREAYLGEKEPVRITENAKIDEFVTAIEEFQLNGVN